MAEVAERLADPERVARVAGAGDNLMRYPGDPRPVWGPLLLSDGHPGVSLLFAELAAGRPELRCRAHAHLAAALRAGLAAQPQRLYAGMVALAFAGHVAATAGGGYTGMLGQLDRHITDQATTRVRADLARLAAGAPAGAWQRYDVLAGLTGTGRYLLTRCQSGGGAVPPDRAGEALVAVLEALVATAVAPGIAVRGQRVPAWWVDEGLEHGIAPHVNLGMAHGISGPLALLALAWRAGFRVPRQDEAIERIVALLSAWRVDDAYGVLWPHMLTLDQLRGEADIPPRSRDSWCYGAAGTARAVHLAGAALDRPGWQADAAAALRGAITAATGAHIQDAALCHGWTGLLHIIVRTALDTTTTAAAEAGWWRLADGVAARACDEFDPGAPFGFGYRHRLAARPLDRPGLLEGAAGAALALHAYASAEVPRTPWDAALLLS